MTLDFHHSKLPNKGPFTWLCAILLDLYEIPFPGVVLPSTPWIGGYTASPILYWLFSYGPISTSVTEFLSQHSHIAEFLRPRGGIYFGWMTDTEYEKGNGEWGEETRLALAAMYIFHFVRRLLESLFLNTYANNKSTRRLSDVELSYYVLWGCICGVSGNIAMTSTYGAISPMIFKVGFSIWVFGQVSNFYCHYLLRLLKNEMAEHRKESGGGSDGHIVPYRFPFNWFIMPHYTAEMIGWTGFCICSGFNTASLCIWILSFGTLQVWTHNRRNQYMKMFKDGKIPKRLKTKYNYDPSHRWGLLPGMEKL